MVARKKGTGFLSKVMLDLDSLDFVVVDCFVVVLVDRAIGRDQGSVTFMNSVLGKKERQGVGSER